MKDDNIIGIIIIITYLLIVIGIIFAIVFMVLEIRSKDTMGNDIIKKLYRYAKIILLVGIISSIYLGMVMTTYLAVGIAPILLTLSWGLNYYTKAYAYKISLLESINDKLEKNSDV